MQRAVYGILKRYGERYKLVVLSTAAGRGARESAARAPRDSVPDPKDRAQNNLARARSRVYELGVCNRWDWFVTLTLDSARYDRYDLGAWRRDFAQWLRNQRRLHGGEYRYLLVPERHADGAWHMHGLMGGIPPGELSLFDPSRHPLDLVRGGFHNWSRCGEKFGFCSLGALRDTARAAAYVLKYVGKGWGDLAEVLGPGMHMYYASQGLAGAEVVGRGGFLLGGARPPDFENEWARVWWSDYDEWSGRLVEPLPSLPPCLATGDAGERVEQLGLTDFI